MAAAEERRGQTLYEAALEVLEENSASPAATSMLRTAAYSCEHIDARNRLMWLHQDRAVTIGYPMDMGEEETADYRRFQAYRGLGAGYHEGQSRQFGATVVSGVRLAAFA